MNKWVRMSNGLFNIIANMEIGPRKSPKVYSKCIKLLKSFNFKVRLSW